MDTTNAAPRRFLVALDGSNLAETVLPLVWTLAKAFDAQVVLLHVLEEGPPATVHGEPHLANAEDAAAYLARTAAQAGAPEQVVESHVHPNPQRDVAGSIAAHAEELNADFIILASHGRGGIRGLLIGRIPQQVAARAGRPVLIVPAPAERDLSVVRRIMVPIDLAGEAEAGIPLARELARACRAELLLITVVPTPGKVPGAAGVATVFLPRTAASLLDWTADRSQERLRGLATHLEEIGLTATTEVRRGDPASELEQAITAYGVDLAVMATHARAGLEGFLAGSVAPRIVGSRLCPVLLVPIGQGNQG